MRLAVTEDCRQNRQTGFEQLHKFTGKYSITVPLEHVVLLNHKVTLGGPLVLQLFPLLWL